MTLVQLRHLIALADTGSFSKAAELVHLTQPALSRSIQALQEALGHPLVERSGRRVELTPIGAQVLDRARQLVADAQDLLDVGHELAGGQVATLRLGMGSGPAAMLMRPMLLAVARTRPGWTVSIGTGATDLLVQRLRERALDALVLDVRSMAPAADLDVDLVHEMRGAWLVRPGHPLARRRSVAFEDLQPYPMASTPLSDDVARMLVEQYGPQAHPQQRVTVRSDDIASLVDVTAHSDAVLLAIRASAPKLHALPMRPPMRATARLGLVTLARRTMPPALALLRQMIGERLRDEPAARAA